MRTTVAMALLLGLAFGCSARPPADTMGGAYNPRLSLQQFDLSSLVNPEEFVEVVSAMLEAQASCNFSTEVLERVTFGGGIEPGMKSDMVTREMCWRQLDVVDVRISSEALALVVLHPRRKRGWQGGGVSMVAVLEEEGWRVYWPEEIEGQFSAPGAAEGA